MNTLFVCVFCGLPIGSNGEGEIQ